MKKISFVLSISIAIFIFSCKKEKDEATPATPPVTPQATPPDTAQPGNYFPVYPGSYWTYLINGTTIQNDSATGYFLHQLNAPNPPYPDDPFFYVPKFNNVFYYGYSTIRVNEFDFRYYTAPALSESIGWASGPDWLVTCSCANGDEVKVVTAKYQESPSMDWVLKLTSHFPSIVNPNFGNVGYLEYRKGKGLISHYIVDTALNDTLYSKVLISYFINH